MKRFHFPRFAKPETWKSENASFPMGIQAILKGGIFAKRDKWKRFISIGYSSDSERMDFRKTWKVETLHFHLVFKRFWKVGFPQNVKSWNASFPLGFKAILKGWIFAKRYKVKTLHFHWELKRFWKVCEIQRGCKGNTRRAKRAAEEIGVAGND